METEVETQEPELSETLRPQVQPLESGGGILAIIPRDTSEAERYARAVIAAGIVPDAYKHKETIRGEGTEVLAQKGAPNKELILMGILKSLEVGLPPITGLGTIVPINNRFAIWGDGAVALIQQHRVIKNHADVEIGTAFEPSLELADWPDDYGWAVSYWRVGQEAPYVGKFTVADAKRSKLWLNTNKDPWIKYPRRMLFNRARAIALRDGFADCLHGLGIVEEIRDTISEVEAAPKAISYADDEPVVETQPEEGAT